MDRENKVSMLVELLMASERKEELLTYSSDDTDTEGWLQGVPTLLPCLDPEIEWLSLHLPPAPLRGHRLP